MTNFVNAVKAMLNLTDDSKIVRFLGKTKKHLKKQIQIREEEISDLKEKLADHKEAVNDTILNVDFDSIQTTDDVNSYVPVYVSNLVSALNSSDSITDAIEAKTEEIAVLNRLIETMDNVKAPVVVESKK